MRTKEGKDHLEWSKKRAVDYLERGDVAGAWISMANDLSNNDELRDHPAIKMGTTMLFAGRLSTREAMEKFIEGFN
jgi:hypothetical protein